MDCFKYSSTRAWYKVYLSRSGERDIYWNAVAPLVTVLDLILNCSKIDTANVHDIMLSSLPAISLVKVAWSGPVIFPHSGDGLEKNIHAAEFCQIALWCLYSNYCCFCMVRKAWCRRTRKKYFISQQLHFWVVRSLCCYTGHISKFSASSEQKFCSFSKCWSLRNSFKPACYKFLDRCTWYW